MPAKNPTEKTFFTDVAIVGAGPGGYTAALRLAKLKKHAVLIDPNGVGGVCLHSGCIPSKELIFSANRLVANENRSAGLFGTDAPKSHPDPVKLFASMRESVELMQREIEAQLCRSKIQVLKGKAFFENANRIRVTMHDEVVFVECKQAVIDSGSVPRESPGVEFSREYVLDSDRLLAEKSFFKDLLILGAGYIGVEYASAFAKLGSNVSLVETGPRILSHMDVEASELVRRKLEEHGVQVFVNTRLRCAKKLHAGAVVDLEVDGRWMELKCDRILVVMGRQGNTNDLGLENTKVSVDESGFIAVDDRCQTQDQSIFAVGDCTGPPLLAHRAFRMGRVAAESIAGFSAAMNFKAIPMVAFSDPQVAEVGLSEAQALNRGLDVVTGKFPFHRLVSAQSSGAMDGFVKVVADRNTGHVLGVVMVGSHVSEFIGEACLGIELNARLSDFAHTIHPHPTFNEALMEACIVALEKMGHGNATDKKP